jgi:integrase/recombinase XerD
VETNTAETNTVETNTVAPEQGAVIPGTHAPASPEVLARLDAPACLDAAAGPDARAVLRPAPVEYAVAVDRYLGQAMLGAGTRRVYRISLSGWAWPLVGKPIPDGTRRRGAVPPVVPLAWLDDPGTGGRLASALVDRVAAGGVRTANRELSALRSAVGWWRDNGWIRTDPVAGLRHRPPVAVVPPLRADQVGELFRLTVSLREHAFWRVLYDTGAPAREVLALDADRLDLVRHRVRARPEAGPLAGLEWQEATSQVLRWLLAGRTWGPVFLTDRRALAAPSPAGVCPVTGRARMSYRRAAEIFTALTQPLDPAGHGWTLHQLSAAQR